MSPGFIFAQLQLGKSIFAQLTFLAQLQLGLVGFAQLQLGIVKFAYQNGENRAKVDKKKLPSLGFDLPCLSF